MILKIPYAKRRPFFLSLNMLSVHACKNVNEAYCHDGCTCHPECKGRRSTDWSMVTVLLLRETRMVVTIVCDVINGHEPVRMTEIFSNDVVSSVGGNMFTFALWPYIHAWQEQM